MPWLPLATAPKSRPTAVAARIPTTAAAHGFHPASTDSFATISPATPKRAVCARDTMPPWPDRKVRLTAARPSQREVSPTWLVTNVENSTGTRTTTASTSPSAARTPRVHDRTSVVPEEAAAGEVLVEEVFAGVVLAGEVLTLLSRRVRSAAPRGSPRAARR